MAQSWPWGNRVKFPSSKIPLKAFTIHFYNQYIDYGTLAWGGVPNRNLR